MATNIVASLHCVILYYILLLIKECGSWPEGTYGIPMPKAGCPSTKEFEWLSGSRTQKTEAQSHASTPIHLAGLESEQTDRIVQNFCMKTSYPRYGTYEWGKGNYCIFKKGDCPKNFKSGWIYWDDAAPLFGTSIQNHSGTVPDGEYDRNTKIEFCCRRDGSITKPIILPTEAPFYLFKMGDGCQEVKNTDVTEEWVYWADEEFINFSGQGGLYPKLHRSKYPIKFTKIYYCYYVPQETPQSQKTMMTVIYCISGIVAGFILIFIITILVQKCCTQKASMPYIVQDSDAGAEEAMIETAPSRTRTNIGAYGTEMSSINNPRHNGTACRDNELENYHPQKTTRTSNPPRYSQLERNKPAGLTQAADNISPMAPSLQPDERPISHPPSYDEVIKEILTENV